MGFRIIGAPAKPYGPLVAEKVCRALEPVAGIAEAHMPLWFEAGLTNGAEQVLVIVLAKGADEGAVRPVLMANLAKQMPMGPRLLVVPITGADGTLGTVRGTGTQIFARPGAILDRPWWKFW